MAFPPSATTVGLMVSSSSAPHIGGLAGNAGAFAAGAQVTSNGAHESGSSCVRI